MIKLEDKLYTSTEVAQVLGVSLRSVYRYIEENKLNPEVKTATGRHRFTKQNIIDFLYPEGQPAEETVVKKEVKEVPTETKKSVKNTEKKVEAPKVVEEREEYKEEKVEVKTVEPEAEPVDWLAKFREAAKRFEEESKPEYEEATAPVQESRYSPFSYAVEEKAPAQAPKTVQKYYYRSRLGGLKDIAQNIDKASKNSGVDYAFTMNAGLSLHSPIKPFSILHAYVKSKDKDFFERILMLTPADEDGAQLCLLVSDDSAIYNGKVEEHGLSVVSKDRLASDIRKSDDDSLIKEAESILG